MDASPQGVQRSLGERGKKTKNRGEETKRKTKKGNKKRERRAKQRTQQNENEDENRARELKHWEFFALWRADPIPKRLAPC
jgi:hypothetical protein